ncbi:hypothetical protein ACJ41O_006149 [Fusarium nematophilum]
MRKLKSIVYKDIQTHQTTTTLDKVFKDRNGEPSGHSPDTEAMVRDWEEVSRRRGRKNIDNLDASSKSTTRRDVDGMSDEQMSRISIYIDENADNEEGKDPDPKGISSEDKAHFNKYKHHQFVRRWGLFSDSDGIDEEWFMATPPVLPGDNPSYLCDMCRHIDFRALLSQRGLPGNQEPGRTSISLLGLWKVMNESESCSFCRLLRRKIAEDRLLAELPADEVEFLSFHLNVLDEGPEYALRLEVEIMDTGRTLNPRFVIQVLEEDERPFHGHAVRQEAADMSRLKRWLQVCDEVHAHQERGQRSPKGALAKTLRLVDTTDNCVREVEIPCEYACLSYVWGTGSHTQYTTRTQAMLEKPGSLATSNIPQTILDAMKVTQEVGLRYIWIDALCIRQDDPQDKERIIGEMGKIYGNAAFTIMASANSSPSDGLPGVGVPRSQEQIKGQVQGMILGVAFQDARRRHDEIEDGRWNSRGWTFQERVLSRRAIYFTKSQMCFVCPHGTACEDTIAVMDPGYKPMPFNDQTQFTSRLHDLWARVWSDPTQAQYTNKAFQTENSIMIMVGEDPERPGEASEDGAPLYKYKAIPSTESLDVPLIDGDTLWDAYAQSVNAYTTRSLTRQSDAINAFLGIADLISQGVNTKFWHGMPEFAFTQSLLWQPREPLKRRLSQEGEALFPSWTWAAWQGHVSYRGRGWHNAVGFAPASVVKWFYEISIEECLENFKISEERTEEEIEDYAQRLHAARFLLKEGYFKGLLHLDYEERGWTVERDETKNQHIFIHEAYPGVRSTIPICLPGESIADLPSENGTLYFEARAASARFCDMLATKPLQKPIQDTFFQIGLDDEERSSNARRPWQHIIYHQGYRAGLLSLNVPREDLNTDLGEEQSYSLIAISRDSIPRIAPPPVGWDMYWTIDPQGMQEKILRDELQPDRNPPPPPDEDASPDESKVNENGDPGWDEGRFGSVGIFDVYNVLLLRKLDGDFSERIGVGKMSYCAFHCAGPELEMVKLR